MRAAAISVTYCCPVVLIRRASMPLTPAIRPSSISETWRVPCLGSLWPHLGVMVNAWLIRARSSRALLLDTVRASATRWAARTIEGARVSVIGVVRAVYLARSDAHLRRT